MYKKNRLLTSLIFTVFFISSTVYSDEFTDDDQLNDESTELVGEEEYPVSSEEETLPEGYSDSSEEELFPERGTSPDDTPEIIENSDKTPPAQNPTESSSTKEENIKQESPTDTSESSSSEGSANAENVSDSQESTGKDKPSTKPIDTQKDTSNTDEDSTGSTSTGDNSVDTPDTSQITDSKEDTAKNPASETTTTSPTETVGNDADETPIETSTTTDHPDPVEVNDLPVHNDTDWFILPDPEQGDDANFYMQTRPGTAIVIDLNIEGVQMQALTLQSSTNSIVINNGDGTVTYTPDKEFFGTDVFTYTYTDANGEKQKGKVKVTVQESVGQPPQPATCQIYATHTEGNGHTQLMTIDPVGYSAVALGPLYQQYDIKGIAIDPINFMLYAISGKNAVTSQVGLLYIVNAHTGELVTIGNINFSGLTALAFRPDGSLWAWSDSEGIIQINKETGVSVLIASIPQVEVVVAVKETTGKEDTTSTTTKTPSPPKNEEKVTGTVLFVDASTEEAVSAEEGVPAEESTGTRKNSTTTTETETTVTTKTIKMKNVQGLAWNSDGSLLYATYGGSRTLWAFNPETSEFKQACDNLPAKVTALETLADGMLMFAIPQKSAGKAYGSKIYVYDPVKCEVILNRSFVTDYSNLESIAWPANCQSLPELKSWKISFDGDTNTAMCLKEPQWVTLKGVAKLDPVNSQAYLETGWRVVSPENVNCPSTDNQGGPVDCTKEQVSSKQIIIGETEFKVTGWWPGIPDNAKGEAAVETLYAANLFDMNGKRLPGRSRIEKTLVGSANLCAEFLDQQPTCVDEEGNPLKECPTKEDTCVDEEGNPLKECPVEKDTCVDKEGNPLEECPTKEDTCVDKEGNPLKECPVEKDTCVDENGKALADCDAKETVKETCAEGEENCLKAVEEQEKATEDDEEIKPLTTPYDKATIENYLAGEDYTFAEDDTSISVWYGGQLLQFAFADLLDETAEKLPPEGELILEATADVNADGYEDYKIIYPDGTVQQVHYLGIIDQKEENVPEETEKEALPAPEEETEIDSEDEQESQPSDEVINSSQDEETNSSENEEADSPKDEEVDSSKVEETDSPKNEEADSPKEEKIDSSKDEKADSPKEEKNTSQPTDTAKEEPAEQKESNTVVPEKQEPTPPPAVEEKPSAPISSSPPATLESGNDSSTSSSDNATSVPIVSD